MNIKLKDIGILPLMMSLPFMFYPKVLSGDTQPWVLIAALVAFFTFRTDSFIYKRDGVLLVLAFFCVLIYVFRGNDEYEIIRNAYTYIAFLIFWVVCRREKGDYFPIAVKATIIIWFIVGLYQFLAIKMGWQIDITGRYITGRMGLPSLTAEPSFYGSISVIHLMYLLSDKNNNNGIFIACAVASVVLSGSLLAMVLLVFPLMKLSGRYLAGSMLILMTLVFSDYYLSLTGVTARIMSIFSDSVNLSSIFLDESLNLRVGHIYFTLYENLIPSLLLLGSIDFMADYNSFASESGLFINTGSNYILPAIGEMIYGAGFLAVLLWISFLNRAQETCMTKKEKIEKIIFIIACMLNPISMSNIFLILYATRRG